MAKRMNILPSDQDQYALWHPIFCTLNVLIWWNELWCCDNTCTRHNLTWIADDKIPQVEVELFRGGVDCWRVEVKLDMSQMIKKSHQRHHLPKLNVGDFCRLMFVMISTFGTSHIASSAYQKWPTKRADSMRYLKNKVSRQTHLKFKNRPRLFQSHEL